MIYHVKGKIPFDFGSDVFPKINGSDRQKFYIENHNKPVTEDEFVAFVTSMPKRELHNSKTRSPSKARQDYRRLVERYGFFPGGQGEAV